ncbi:hypothetical protein A3194_05270 [Candidatus Thiodiazotropha endoloripes]|uniref:protein-export chaperone SecB n=1 Tax=Candidatus Thiodiazotropha endoloripes TaxID=1818881 RepID=UPI00083CE007|nr:protein-export chaperone SecB [Candidatus Thiodiazotropha endoloripes]ODB94071.1 hypothetical protein A3194_05270 [Candidatus Thiodiazotropha endoloripes]
MNDNPLEINRIFFPSQYIKANPEHKPDQEKSIPITLNHTILRVNDSNNLYSVEVMIMLDKEASVNTPYEFDTHAFGFFSFSDPDIDEDKKKYLLGTSGIQILIGALREHILSITSRGPWGPLTLSTIQINVINSDKKNDD